MRFRQVKSLKISKGASVMSIAADARTVFVANYLRCLVAFEAGSYSLRWQIPLRGFDAVACMSGALVAQSHTGVSLMEPSTGSPRWTTQGTFAGSGEQDESVLLWLADDRTVQRVDVTSGRAMEAIGLPARRAVRPCGEILALLDRDSDDRPMDPVLGFSLRTKSVQWRADLLDTFWSTGPPRMPDEAPRLHTFAGYLFCETPRRLMGIDPASGQAIWHTTLPQRVDEYGWSRLACGRIFPAGGGRLYGVCLKTGRVEFTRPLNNIGDGEFAPMGCAEYGGCVLLVGGDGLIFLRPDTGEEVARHGRPMGSPYVVNDDIVVLGSYGEVRVIREIR